jgi:predicted nucleotidyltransferase
VAPESWKLKAENPVRFAPTLERESQSQKPRRPNLFGTTMHPTIAQKAPQIAELCRRHGVRRLDLFGSAARGTDFDPEHSDADFLIEFEDDTGAASRLERCLNLERDLAQLLQRRVDLVERHALESSRNYIRRRSILRGAESIYG